MSDGPTLLFLEADDEITAVVRRVRAAEPGSVVIVAPGRSRATSSVVGLRLLARAGEANEREVAVVGDPLTRSLAAEAGLVAYASVEEARRGEPAAAPDALAPRHAAIHVVRGPVADESAPTLAAVRAAVPDDETRAVPVARPAPGIRPLRRRPRPSVAVAAALGALLVAGGVAAAFVLPAATIRIAPETASIGPIAYDLTIEDAERVEGEVEASAEVVASGTYEVLEAATGTVVFFNWNVYAVEVPVETLVAAGEQAFATVEGIVVPPGTLTPDGRIQAGDAVVGVVAAAPGPAANVAAEAIDTVLNSGTAAQLRGFPNNPERLVINPEATSGGIDESGIEITQADVDAAVATLRDELAAAVTDALEGTSDGPYADPAEPQEPAIEGLDDLVGTRDQERAEISGTLDYDRLRADADEVRGRAADRFADDGSLLPDGHELLADATTVTLGAASRQADALVVHVTVTGRSAASIDRAEVIERAAGRTPEDAMAALADLGEVRVDLWPGWVSTVPSAAWRIDVERVADEPAPSPGGP